MSAGCALFHSADVQRRRPKVHLVPAQVHQFGCSQAVPIRYKEHRGVPVTPTVSSGGVHETFDLGLGQIFPRPQFTV